MINSVTLVGEVSRDVDLRATNEGTPWGTVNLKLSRAFKKRDGSEGSATTFVDVKVFGQAAELADGLKAGDSVLVIGELKTDSWDDKTTGKKQFKLVVDARQLAPLGGQSPTDDLGPDEPAGVGAASGGSGEGDDCPF